MEHMMEPYSKRFFLGRVLQAAVQMSKLGKILQDDKDRPMTIYIDNRELNLLLGIFQRHILMLTKPKNANS
jgi:hypothetical protein